MRSSCRLLVPALMALLAAGCQPAVNFPAHSLQSAAVAAGAFGAYATHGGAKADFFTFAAPDGRINRIGYGTDANGVCLDLVDLDAIAFDQCRHLVIVLDGFGYDLVNEFYDAGGLRYCHAPSRVLSTYPPMTDLALADVFECGNCANFEAMYYDPNTRSIQGGSSAYLAGKNEPYNTALQYRADMIMDAVSYLYADSVWSHELNGVKKLFDQNKTRELNAYFVSSAAVSTREGAEGQRMVLRGVDRLINQIMCETRGKVKVTITADHGHSYTAATRIALEKYLTDKGWRLVDHVENPKDVAYVRFGLETYAAFGASNPPELAKDLIECPGVELASYAQGDRVIVLGSGQDANADSSLRTTAPNWTKLAAGPGAGSAAISKKGNRYKYEATTGDPLMLKATLSHLKADSEGYYDANELMAATMTHYYPGALERMWRAHFELARTRPDVIVSLCDRFYSGSTAFAGAVSIASTHGALNYWNSTTFLMSSVGPLPPYMRSAQVRAALSKLIGQTWPMKK